MNSTSVNPKIHSEHLGRLAIVYVRQSTARQVIEHQESTRLQYQLVDRAAALGWPADRIIVIDDDLGISGTTAEGRSGFQRLLAEVGLNHVGLVLGIEMSRISRSNKDWHQLLELCGIFGCLLADQDGLYDPADFNDRLLLGLKGTMSEAELHILRGRMLAGSRNKAKRGELITHLPMGYVRSPSDEVILDPVPEAQEAIRLLFRKFQELGSARAVVRYLRSNEIRLPIRPFHGPQKGELDWREALYSTVNQMLHNPTYAGTYTHGRYQQDVRKRHLGHGAGRFRAAADQWRVVIHDHLPAYITWDQFLSNLEALKKNRTRFDARGVPRNGNALLSGLVVCGRCGRRIFTHYKPGKRDPAYTCQGNARQIAGSICQRLMAPNLDKLVGSLVLRAVEPAAIELAIASEQTERRDRSIVEKQWQDRLALAEEEVRVAQLRYESVDPTNRQVAASLEKKWEAALSQLRNFKEDQERIGKRELPATSGAKLRQVRQLCAEIPRLWNADSTTNAERQMIARQLIRQVSVAVVGQTEVVDVQIEWAGGQITDHQIYRPIARYEDLADYKQLKRFIIKLWKQGYATPAIAERVNESGFRTPRLLSPYSHTLVRKLLDRWGQTEPMRAQVAKQDAKLGPNEWWLMDLGIEIGVDVSTLSRWIRNGWLHGRRATPRSKWWIAWADADECDRLRKLAGLSNSGTRHPKELKTPKNRPAV